MSKKSDKWLELEIKKINKRMQRLRTKRGAENALFWGHTHSGNHISVRGDQFDCKPWLLACDNCVIDLRTGEGRPGRREDLLTKASGIKWKDVLHPAGLWEQSLLEIFGGDDELVGYLQRLLGYGITGQTTEHCLPIFYGRGRNGKTTIIETLCHVLGPLARPIQSEILMDQGRYRRSSAAPSPDIMGLRGLRLAFASELDEGRRISPSRVKWLTGGDTLVGRNPHDRFEVEFVPTHLLILSTNEKPSAPADDFAFWERVHLIPFPVSFVTHKPQIKNERPADKTLLERLKEEGSGVLAWLVRGALAWQEQGLSPPLCVVHATQEYRRDEDLLADFIEACCFCQ